eukprot:2807298-Rhodomonas_salina.1
MFRCVRWRERSHSKAALIASMLISSVLSPLFASFAACSAPSRHPTLTEPQLESSTAVPQRAITSMDIDAGVAHHPRLSQAALLCVKPSSSRRQHHIIVFPSSHLHPCASAATASRTHALHALHEVLGILGWEENVLDFHQTAPARPLSEHMKAEQEGQEEEERERGLTRCAQMLVEIRGTKTSEIKTARDKKKQENKRGRNRVQFRGVDGGARTVR